MKRSFGMRFCKFCDKCLGMVEDVNSSYLCDECNSIEFQRNMDMEKTYVSYGLKQRTNEECVRLGLNPNPNPSSRFASWTRADMKKAAVEGAQAFLRLLGTKTDEYGMPIENSKGNTKVNKK